MMLEITRKLEFDYGHRVLGHEGKCKHLHGHRGVAEISIAAPLDSIGRIIDFGQVKALVGKWIDDNWDHNILLNSEDDLSLFYRSIPHSDLVASIFAGKKPYFMSSGNPTAENMATELYAIATNLLGPDYTITKIRIWETPACYADYIPR